MGVYDLTGNTIKADGFTGSAASAAITALVSLTDNSGGAADNTLAVVSNIALSTTNTYTDAAVNAAVNAPLGVIKNDLADLAAKVNAIIAALKA